MTKENKLKDRNLLNYYLGKCEALIRFNNNSYLLDSKPTHLIYTDSLSVAHYEHGYKQAIKYCLWDNSTLYNHALVAFENAMKPYHYENVYDSLNDVEQM